MAKTSSGVYRLPNGMWGFKYAFWIDGKQKAIKRTKDDNGNQFKTERAATNREKIRNKTVFFTLSSKKMMPSYIFKYIYDATLNIALCIHFVNRLFHVFSFPKTLLNMTEHKQKGRKIPMISRPFL